MLTMTLDSDSSRFSLHWQMLHHRLAATITRNASDSISMRLAEAYPLLSTVCRAPMNPDNSKTTIHSRLHLSFFH